MFNLVWLKRDLRVADHAALHAAAVSGPLVALYADEPSMWAQADASARHRHFIAQSLTALNGDLQTRGIQLCVAQGEMPQLLAQIFERCGAFALWSHEETGNAWSFARDLRVKAWCRENGVPWREFPQNGVIRALKKRTGWASVWEARMHEPLAADIIVADAYGSRVVGEHMLAQLEISDGAAAFSKRMDVGLREDGSGRTQQRGGSAPAEALLASFLAGRGRDYRFALSRPLEARTACSRLSPHIAFGTISLRTVVQAVRGALAQLHADNIDSSADAPSSVGMAKSLNALLSRLHWHCHFMQKLESRPELEFQNMHSAYDNLRSGPINKYYLDAWSSGQTGFPFVDASMRALHVTGWMNFRMRALLCSFASYQLWLPWQATALHLACEFTDYEPGIHYSQMQMQSGTTGINTIRMYSPVKQSRDQDPRGVFIRKYCPELKKLDDEQIHEPWLVDKTILQRAGIIIGETYPEPIVELESSARAARDAIWSVRNAPGFREEAAQLQLLLGSKASGMSAVRRGAAKVRSKTKRAATTNAIVDQQQITLDFSD